MRRLINRLFQLEEINGNGLCETYLFRWTLLSTRWGKIYLHHFVGDDWSRDLHDHPKRFISIGLWGSYYEESAALGHVFVPHLCCYRPGVDHLNFRTYRAPWIRTFPAKHKHRLRLIGDSCWTLVVVGRPEREWGFWPNGRFIPFREYVHGEAALAGRDC